MMKVFHDLLPVKHKDGDHKNEAKKRDQQVKRDPELIEPATEEPRVLPFGDCICFGFECRDLSIREKYLKRITILTCALCMHVKSLMVFGGKKCAEQTDHDDEERKRKMLDH